MTLSDENQPRPEKKRILIVEDEFFIAMELKAVLAKAGYEVIGPVSGVNDALDLLTRERPDAAILDMNVSDGQVAPVAAVLKTMGVPFVLATASDSAEITGSSVLREATDLGKPTDIRRLLDAVRAMVNAG